MKIKHNILIFTLLVMMSVPVSAAPISNPEIYDPTTASKDVQFTADGMQGSTTGSGSSETTSDQSQSPSSQNAALSRELNESVKSLAKKQEEKTLTVALPGSAFIVKNDYTLSKGSLESILGLGLGFHNIEGLYGIKDISLKGVAVSENTKSTIEQIEMDHASEGSISLPAGSFTFPDLSLIDISGWLAEQQKAWNGTGTRYSIERTDLISGGFMDFPYMETRYEVLSQLYSSASTEELIDVINIQEYKVSGEEDQSIISKQPIGEYRWEVCDENGTVLKTLTSYGRSIRLSFSKAGTYYIKAYQRHYVTKADKVSTMLNEYWILADTGAVLWKQQKTGQEYTYNRIVEEEFIQTNYILQEVTEAMLDQSWLSQLGSNGQLFITEGFQTERIK